MTDGDSLESVEPNVTLLLQRYAGGDQAALDQLAGLLYPQLKKMARRRVRRGQEIGATTLVQETFLKLLSGGGVKPQDRVQFFGLAATIMRQVIVDDARHSAAQKRRGVEVEFKPEIANDSQLVDAGFLLQVDDALTRLAEQNRQLAQVFECRYFGGYSIQETADIINMSVRSTERLWSNARKLLAIELRN
ncbi:MAG: ECF-type sigma factor [Lysobacterales bacterium]